MDGPNRIRNTLQPYWARLWSDCRARGANVGDNDLWIAATAVRLDLPVATLDGDFQRISGLRIIDEAGAERVTA